MQTKKVLKVGAFVPGRVFIATKVTQPSLTVPGQSLPLRKIIESFSNGSYADVRTHKVHYDGIDDFDSPLAGIERKDIADVHNLSLSLLQNSQKLDEFVKKSKGKPKVSDAPESPAGRQAPKAKRSEAEGAVADGVGLDGD